MAISATFDSYISALEWNPNGYYGGVSFRLTNGVGSDTIPAGTSLNITLNLPSTVTATAMDVFDNNDTGNTRKATYLGGFNWVLYTVEDIAAESWCEIKLKLYAREQDIVTGDITLDSIGGSDNDGDIAEITIGTTVDFSNNLIAYEVTNVTEPYWDESTEKWKFAFDIVNVGSFAWDSGAVFGVVILPSGQPAIETFTCDKGTRSTSMSFPYVFLTLTEEISVSESLTIEGNMNSNAGHYTFFAKSFELKGVSSITVPVSGFGIWFYYPSGVLMLTPKTNVATVVDGLWQGTTELKVKADVPDGTSILIYKGSEYISQAKTTEGIAYVPIVSNQLNQGDAITAYANLKGQYTYGAQIVSASPTAKIGWREPNLVDSTEYAVWAANGGEEISDLYDPVNSGNFGSANDNDCICDDFTPYYTMEIKRDGDDVIATITDVSPSFGIARFQWDDGSIGNTNTETYADISGTSTQKVKILHQSDDSLYIEREFEVTDSLASSTSQIWGASYEPNYAANQSVALIAYSEAPALQGRIVELDSGAWKDLNPSGGGAYKFINTAYYAVPSGSYTLEFRVTGDTEILTFTAKIDW